MQRAVHVDFDSDGNLTTPRLRTTSPGRVDKVTGVVTTVAGNGEPGYRGDGGPAYRRRCKNHTHCRLTLTATLRSDRLNAVVRKVDASPGTITTVAGTGEIGYSGDGGLGHQAMFREPNDCFLMEKEAC
ncbi:MAG: hypothetical protein Ct9H300mP11_32350 [Chloroflexota bacterium]|nr:MAG: hypothetical protein Ct9H300mP11_32350 [Chloroflexota bacterium]